MNTLQIADTFEAKMDLVFNVFDNMMDRVDPIFVISHNRSLDAPTLELLKPLPRELVTVVVAEHEVVDYALNYPEVQRLAIPAAYRADIGMGVGRARQFCLDHAAEQGLERVVIMDDDFTNSRMMYTDEKGELRLGLFGALSPADIKVYRAGLFVLSSLVAQDAFEAHPELAMVGTQRIGSRRSDNPSLRYQLNDGLFPTQYVHWNGDRFRKLVGEIDLPRFNRHGEDLFATMAVIHAGGSVGRVSSVVMDTWDQYQSVIRTPETDQPLRMGEYRGFQEYAFKEFLATRWKDGAPWSRPDWKKIYEAGVATNVKVPWTASSHI